MGFEKKIIQAGTGAMASIGKRAFVHYTGRLTSGKVFDSSIPRGQPFSFTLGRQEVIRGWDEGVATMQVGEKAEFTITPDYAYGARGAGGVIPPNATLIFDVELLNLA
eukprot:TRINITY_DN1503_c0_g1_i2.p2 TRINITY_DN1503_c0_g1~~TRINITY_DN1503_c0_g1_i2.p2  ORF type:complete len:108 (+),score=48.14 TRINITY_DN1503_c0_g1_i2:1-324(+)